MAVDLLIQNAIQDMLRDGHGLGDTLAAMLRRAEPGAFDFCLSSAQGMLAQSRRPDGTVGRLSLPQNALPLLVPEAEASRRLLLATAPDCWQGTTCFALGDVPVYAALQLAQPQAATPGIRTVFCDLLNGATDLCAGIFRNFQHSLLSAPAIPESASPNARVKAVIERLAGYSDHVRCVVLLDNDGFHLAAAGNLENVEQVAGNLAMFHHRASQELGHMGIGHVLSEAFSCAERTVRIGPVKQTNLALAISVQGPYAAAQAALLFALGHAALQVIAAEEGELWGAKIEPIEPALRIRDAWFSLPRLVPKGELVAKKGGKTFHLPACPCLAKSPAARLVWFQKRAEALRVGGEPCRSCNP